MAVVISDAQQIIESDDEEFEAVEESPNNGDYVEFGIESHLSRSPLSKHLRFCLGICGFICITLSLTAVACGGVTLAMAANRVKVPQEHNYFAISGFGLIVLLFAGIESCRKAYSGNFGSSTLIVFSTLSLVSSVCTVVAQSINLNYSTQAAHFVRDEVKIEILLLVYCLSCAFVNVGQILIGIKALNSGRVRLSFTNYELVGNRGGVWICLIGLLEIIVGVLISCLMMAIDTSHYSQASKVSNEDECIGWFTTLSGVSLLLPACFSSCKGVLYCTITIQSLITIATFRFVTIPTSMLYLFWYDSEFPRGVTVTLLAMNVVVIVAAGYCFITLILQIFNFDQSIVNQLDDLMRKRWPLYSYIPMIQVILAALYVLLSLAGYLEKFLYAIDFTPLPLFLLFHAAISYKVRYQQSPCLLLINFGWITICELLSLRDVYLFDYHTAVVETPDNWYKNQTLRSSGSKIGVHIGLGAVSLMELLVGLATSAMYLRTVLDALEFVFDRTLYRGTVRILHLTGVVQLLCSGIMLNLGFIIFLSNSLASEMLGDHAIYISALAVLTSIVTIISGRVYNVLPFAFILQILNAFFSWQAVDYCGDLLEMLLTKDGDFFPTYKLKQGFLTPEKITSIAVISFVLLIIQLIIGGITVLLADDVVESGQYKPKVAHIEMSNIEQT